MGTTKEMIREWLDEAKENGCTHMIVACDTFEYDDYPIYVMPDEDVKKKLEEVRGASMQTVMEVYNMSLPLEEQLQQLRVYNL